MLCVALVCAQKFEVASVKPAGPERDGPRAFVNGPERVVIERGSLLQFINLAYRLQWDQISGPKWIADEYYEVNAKIPPGSSKERIQLMWQDLLAERFGLKVHMSEKEMPGYELVVAKSGPKFHVEPGFPEPPAGKRYARVGIPPRTWRQTFIGYSMAEFCGQLAWVVAPQYQAWPGHFSVGHVTDETGLKGTYDFTFEFAGGLQSGAYPPPLPDDQSDTAALFFDALQQQLGLRLVEKKVRAPLLVIDAANRTPSEN
jgi:uncharacterized protein (TIGR03435 family)